MIAPANLWIVLPPAPAGVMRVVGPLIRPPVGCQWRVHVSYNLGAGEKALVPSYFIH